MAKANPFRFSTKYQDDETDLVYYGNRYLNSSIGRWLSRDPIGESFEPGAYVFVNNASVLHFDVRGLWDYRVHQYRTLVWAGQRGISLYASWNIALANQLVDSLYPVYELQFGLPVVTISDAYWSWHFNRSADPASDSRLQHRDEELASAQRLCNWALGNDAALEAATFLGYALHPYQDIYAHGDFNRKVEAPRIAGTSSFERRHYMHNYDEDGDPSGYWTSFPKPDDPDLDAFGWFGIPTIHTMLLGTELSNRDRTYYTHFYPGNQRIRETEIATKSFLSEYQGYVRAHAKPCGECMKAFGGGN